MTLEEDFALLLDFAELLEDFALLLDTLVSLLLDFGVTLEEDFVLLLDSFLLEEDWRSPLEAGMTEEEEDFDFSTEEEDFSLLEFFCELEEFLEIFSLLELASLQSSFCSSHWRGSGETEEEDSSPHATSRARRMDRANNMRSECRGRLLAD